MMFTLILPGFAVAGGKGETVTGSLTIYKYEQEKGDEKKKGTGEAGENPVGAPLKGVTFQLTQTHKYDPLTDKWTEFSGTSVDYETDENGKIEISDIPLGRYKVQEIDGPPHVVLNNKEYFVDIPMTNKEGTEVNYDVHIYPKNEIIRGKVKLKKYDGETREGLQSVTFELYEKGKTAPIKTGLTTNENGEIVIGSLPYGEYYFKEVSTVNGYLLNGEKVEFSIDEQGVTKYVSLDNFKKPEVEKTVDKDAVNRGEKVTYEITLQLPADIQSYDSFVVTDTLHEHLQYVDGSEGSPAGFTFTANGQELTWTANPQQLQPGKVTLTFDAIVSKDAVPNEPIENEATIDYDNSYVVDSETTPPVTVTPTAGSLVVIKQDGNDNDVKLSGAKFELRDANGVVVATGTSGNDGVVNFDGDTNELDYGTYELVETKAPNGYNKLRNPIEVVIDKDNTEVTIEVDNYKSGWELPKTGGIGTLFFTLIGLTLMTSAAMMYFRRKRGEEV